MNSSDMLPTAAGKTGMSLYWRHGSSQHLALNYQGLFSWSGYKAQQIDCRIGGLSVTQRYLAAFQLLDNYKDQEVA